MDKPQESLLAAGFKNHRVPVLYLCDEFWQKRITDDEGTRYFVNAGIYSLYGRTSIQFDVQFKTPDGEHFNITTVGNFTVDGACEFFATMFAAMGCQYYERDTDG